MIDEFNNIRVESKENWLKVLENEELLGKTKIIDILKFVYMSNHHLSNCGEIAKYMNEEVGSINSMISSFGKRVLDLLNLPEVEGIRGNNRRWNIPFMTVDELNHNGIFIWKLRPELISALEEKYLLKKEYEESIDEGAKFVLLNFDKTLELINTHPEYRKFKNKVIAEYSRIKYIKYTGNMYEHFLKFKGGNHKYADDFAFLNDYGILTNEDISDYLVNNYPEEMNHYYGIDDLVVGNVYSNSEIANTFKCSNMGGMRRSLDTNTLVLIAKHNNPLYDDQWTDDGILNYTGMGTEGDQSIEYAQNKTLTIAKRENIKVYLFESYKDNEYYYAGQVELIKAPYQDEEPDVNGIMRKVIKFPLKRIDPTRSIIIDIDDIENSEQEKIKEVRKHELNEIKERAKLAENEYVTVKEVKTLYRQRDQFIAEHTKRRAKGICDLCGEEAPFKDKNGNPYLESHHVITLADNGPDAIYNTVAICPNCHRRIHVLHSKEDIEKLENVIQKYLLDDNDRKNLKKWEELFK